MIDKPVNQKDVQGKLRWDVNETPIFKFISKCPRQLAIRKDINVKKGMYIQMNKLCVIRQYRITHMSDIKFSI